MSIRVVPDYAINDQDAPAGRRGKSHTRYGNSAKPDRLSLGLPLPTGSGTALTVALAHTGSGSIALTCGSVDSTRGETRVKRQ